MDKNKRTFLLLGLGVGIVVTNVLNYIYPKIQYEELPDEVIISRAKELGMVSLSDSLILNEKTKETDEISEVEEKKVDKMQLETKNLEEVNENDLNEKEDAKNSIEFIVNKGESLSIVAERLKENDIIEDELSFKDYVVSKEMQSKIKYGTFNLNKNDSYEEILKKLMGK